MKKWLFLVALLMFISSSANAQIGNFREKLKSAANTSETTPTETGKIYYVSASTGSNRNTGGKSDPVKDLQKAIDLAEDGSTILVAEGNYLGNLDRGYISVGTFGSAADVGKFLKIYGGYSADFSERDVLKYISKIQPGQASARTIKGALLNFTAKRANGGGPAGEVVIDGLTFDYGEVSLYCAPDPSDPRTGTPNDGVLTGRLLEPGASPQGFAAIGYMNMDIYAIRLDVSGDVKIQNCTFVNCRNYGIQGSMGAGHIEISNNVFIACRYAACAIVGSVRDADIDKVSLDFHHNTVLFTWTRTKVMEDMGQGFRFMNRIRTIDVHHNIFGCNTRCAVERTYYESNKALEAAKVSNLYDNYFFANHYDLEISNGASVGINVPANRIEEAEEISKYEGNQEMPVNEKFISAIDESYLKGYMGLSLTVSSNYDANSAANQVNRLFGLNQQGTETVRVSMFANKYPWEKAKDLFGTVSGYGAQLPNR